jgi:hypothetical protein
MILKIRVTSPVAAALLGAGECMLESRISQAVRKTGLAVGLALCVHGTANTRAAVLKITPDARVLRLERFFSRYQCPDPQHVFAYLRAADRYRLDYRILPAISFRETTCGLTEARNNRWGYHPGLGFSTVEEGIDYVARQLAQSPKYKGKTLRDKLYTYNPRPKYPGEIQSIMRDIDPR